MISHFDVNMAAFFIYDRRDELVKLFSPYCFTILLIFTFSNASICHAYVGPGAGVSLLGSLLGVLLALGSLFVIVLVWPVRRALKKRKKINDDAK